jgi:hypothetical protein
VATAIKALRTLVAAGTSNTAGSTTNGTTWNLTTALGGVMTANVTNGATGPTIGCDFVVQISGDGVNWKDASRQTTPTANGGNYPYTFEIPRKSCTPGRRSRTTRARPSRSKRSGRNSRASGD